MFLVRSPLCPSIINLSCHIQARRWPDLNLKSPGVKPRSILVRSHHPTPLTSVSERTAPLHSDKDGEDTPRTPLTASAPHTPPPHTGSISSPSDFSVFATVVLGPSGKSLLSPGPFGKQGSESYAVLCVFVPFRYRQHVAGAAVPRALPVHREPGIAHFSAGTGGSRRVGGTGRVPGHVALLRAPAAHPAIPRSGQDAPAG